MPAGRECFGISLTEMCFSFLNLLKGSLPLPKINLQVVDFLAGLRVSGVALKTIDLKSPRIGARKEQ